MVFSSKEKIDKWQVAKKNEKLFLKKYNSSLKSVHLAAQNFLYDSTRNQASHC
jgi:hypothetical protein